MWLQINNSMYKLTPTNEHLMRACGLDYAKSVDDLAKVMNRAKMDLIRRASAADDLAQIHELSEKLNNAKEFKIE